jgi:hypothetical protein
MKLNINIGVNAIVEDWRKDTTSILKGEAGRYSSREFRVRSAKKIDEYGEIKYIGLKIDKSGVFYEKGVGRGRGIGTGKETPTPWFNPVIEKQMPILADDLGLEISNMLARVLIK